MWGRRVISSCHLLTMAIFASRSSGLHHQNCLFSANVALFSRLTRSDCCEEEDDKAKVLQERGLKKDFSCDMDETKQSSLEHYFQTETIHTFTLSNQIYVRESRGVDSMLRMLLLGLNAASSHPRMAALR